MAPTNPLVEHDLDGGRPGLDDRPRQRHAGNNGYAGQVSAIAVDPSDPSGNTVYVAGASGGVWKTTNFLTTDPQRARPRSR